MYKMILVDVFNYLLEHYGLTDGIYVKVENAVFDYIWTVEASNLTFKFESIDMFEEAYNTIQNTNTVYQF